MKVVALAGGVGGAKLAHGLAILGNEVELTVVVNTGDDFEHLGLQICPDLDTVMYTLAGLANPVTGWGPQDETFHALERLEQLGAPAWFRLGDRDLALHIERTRRLRAGERKTEVTLDVSRRLGVGPRILPMTDSDVPTRVLTSGGELDFQDYFVRQRCEPVVTGFRFAGIEDARPTPEVLQALNDADVVLFGPSNPFVSIEPILSLAGIRELIASKPSAAISPIVGGQAIKGPAAKMLLELGLDASAAAVAQRYAGLVGGYVIDEQDEALAGSIEAESFSVLVTNTLMTNDEDRRRLAQEVLDFACSLAAVGAQKRAV
jgi:LPPG:FO 2-phospho-L-lactate transferase